MIPKAYPPRREQGHAAGTLLGADVGATLAKIVAVFPDGRRERRLVPSADADSVVATVAEFAPQRTGLTGGGGSRLAPRLAGAPRMTGEFEAWATGARAMLREQLESPPEAFLLVSVGTGTSAMLVRGPESVRVGGTALGGGTVVGLAKALFGSSDFDDISLRAKRGDRRRVDLLVRDAYPGGDAPLPGELNAASFARLAREEAPPDDDDLAHAVMGLVAENVALICGGLAAAAGVAHIVYGGATIRGNDSVSDILRAVAPLHGCRAIVLSRGEFTGARGALELAASSVA